MRQRLLALAAVAGFLALGLGVRFLSGGGTADGEGALAQHSGTVLYACLIYAGIFVLAPATRPVIAAVVALAFCWAVELLQLTGISASLSQRSLLARLTLGVAFDPQDLLWYALGVLASAGLHWGLRRGLRHRRGTSNGHAAARQRRTDSSRP